MLLFRTVVNFLPKGEMTLAFRATLLAFFHVLQDQKDRGAFRFLRGVLKLRWTGMAWIAECTDCDERVGENEGL